jgi:hypothetical protein
MGLQNSGVHPGASSRRPGGASDWPPIAVDPARGLVFPRDSGLNISQSVSKKSIPPPFVKGVGGDAGDFLDTLSAIRMLLLGLCH